MNRTFAQPVGLGAVVALVLALAVAVATPSTSQAVTRDDWDPGFIISDEEFYNANSMTETQIQAFLVAKVPVCEEWKSVGPDDPIVCLKNYTMTTQTFAPDALCPGGYVGAASESAAAIIYKVAQSCNINPRVLLVTLEKEMSLVGHTFPSTWRYTKAMGFGCSDTAPCVETYAGFQKQVFLAAKQFQRYRANPGNYNYRAGRVNNIYYYPPNQRPECGYSEVYIRNVATASLYNYTPYQPNTAALNNLYGTGDWCSSYGNRNFWRLYNDWFGSPLAEPPMTRTDATDYLAGIDSRGDMWAYPVAKAGGWSPRASLGAGWSGIQQLVGIGDFDGNGKRDLIGIDASRTAWLYKGDGRMVYPTRVRLDVSWANAKFVVYGGNGNGDAIPDVYTVDQAGKLWLWPGAGDGTFSSPQVAGNGFTTSTLLAGPGDLTGDGCGDLLSRSESGELFLLAGNCQGGFATPVTLGTGWSTIVDVYGLDLDKDGSLDLLARTSVGQLHMWKGNGAGGITYQGVVDAGWATMGAVTGAGPLTLPEGSDGSPSPTPQPSPEPSPSQTPEPPPSPTPKVPTPPGATGLGDFDGDGKRDYFGVTLAGQLKLYRGNGTGGVYTATPTVAPNWGTSAVTIPVGDFNSDGYQDIGRFTSTGDFQVAFGDGSGTVGSPTSVAVGWSNYNLVMSGFDWDGDGKIDVIARDKSGNLWLHRSDGVGGWLSSTPRQIGSGWGPFTAIFPVGDFDGRGGVDLLARAPDGVLWLYPGNGTGAFLAARSIDRGWASFVTLFSPGNYDGVTGTDVFARTADGRLYLYSGTGTGVFRQQYRLVDSGWHTMHSIG